VIMPDTTANLARHHLLVQPSIAAVRRGSEGT